MGKEMIAMLLAGGQGSRLYALTQKLAKPAVPFGGKYRIIDFPLSNCVNSGIDTVGILTQYQPLELNEYIGNGQPWDLDRIYGGVHVLPPYQKASGSDWYKGTANAIYQNISFIERYDPEYVIILSGDQICKQDYSDFLRFHKEKNAEFSVAVMEVPWEEAPRFGLMVTDDDDRITEFQEKPKNPKSNLASMGIYIFNWWIKSLLASYIVTGISLLVLTFFMYKFELNEKIVSAAIVGIYVVSTLIGGMIIGKLTKSKRYLWGMVLGIIYFVLLLLITLGVYRTLNGDSVSIVTSLILCAGGGMTGGMIS